MAIYTFKGAQLTSVEETTLRKEKIMERRHLQTALKNNIKVIAEDCLVIAEEFSDWEETGRRIDLLAIDKEANLVVIELKRDKDAEMDLQALRYAALVSTLTFQKAVETYKEHLEKNERSDKDAKTDMLDFLEWEEEKKDFAQKVRIILVSEGFSDELTTLVLWLNEQVSVPAFISCVRLIPYKHGNELLIDAQQIIPLPEAEEYQIKVREQERERAEIRESKRDLTKYTFEGSDPYSKRRLVLVIVLHWVKKENPATLRELEAAFPSTLHSRQLFVTREEGEKIDGGRRYFLKEGEEIRTGDGKEYYVTNQWGGGIKEFIEHARNKFGYTITKADN